MSTVNRIKLTIPQVRNLKCPFTGRPLGVYVSISEGIATYSAPDAFTLSEPVASVDLLYNRASMRNGVAGVADGDDRLVDPYTGERFSLAAADGKFWFEGGFNPRMPVLYLADFLKKASCGKVDVGAAPILRTVDREPEETKDETELAHESVEEMTEESGEKIAKAVGANRGRVTVSMSQKRKAK